MMNKPKVFFLLALLVVFAISTLADSASLGMKTKILHFAVSYPFDFNYDPVERNYIYLQALFRSIYSTLFTLDSQLRVHPLLLEHYEQKGKTVIFRIKENARFSDGSPITAADVIRSIEVGMRHSSCPNPVYKAIEGGEEFFQGKTQRCTGIKDNGPQTVEICLKDENVDFAYYFTAGIMSVLPQHRNRSRKPGDMSFSGIFRVVDFQKKEKESIVTLAQNPYYIGKKSRIETLIVHFYHDLTDFEKVIRKGEPDLFLYNYHIKLPRSMYKYNYFKTPSFGAFYFKLNASKGPFRDKRLRTFFKNFILSWDPARSEKWELTTPSRMVLPYSLPGYFVFNPMVPGSFKELAPKEKIKIACVNPRAGIRQTLMPLLKKKLSNYNLDLELEWEDIDKVQEREKKRDFDLTSYYYVVDVPLSSYFYENLFTPGHELNLFNYEVPEALELLADYRKEKDEFKKLKILSRLETIAQEEAFLIPLLNPLSLLGYKSYVKNVRIDKFLNIYFEDIDVKKGH
jgi:ABC-type oligopeptide transport system substrate-binding subunit